MQNLLRPREQLSPISIAAPRCLPFPEDPVSPKRASPFSLDQGISPGDPRWLGRWSTSAKHRQIERAEPSIPRRSSTSPSGDHPTNASGKSMGVLDAPGNRVPLRFRRTAPRSNSVQKRKNHWFQQRDHEPCWQNSTDSLVIVQERFFLGVLHLETAPRMNGRHKAPVSDPTNDRPRELGKQALKTSGRGISTGQRSPEFVPRETRRNSGDSKGDAVL